MNNYTNDIWKAMKNAGCTESILFGDYLHRMKFKSNELALEHRRTTGCVGWVLQEYVYTGCKWTPTLVFKYSPFGGGTLE